MGFEGVVLPGLQIGDGFGVWSNVKILVFSMRMVAGAYQIVVDAGIFVQWERGLAVARRWSESRHGLEAFFFSSSLRFERGESSRCG